MRFLIPALFLCFTSHCICESDQSIDDWNKLYVGTYTDPKGKGDGIYIYGFSYKNGNGSFKYYDTIKNIKNPGFLAVTRNKKYLYAVSESENLNESSIHAYQLNGDGRNQYKFIDSYPTNGTSSAHVFVNDQDGFVYVSNYNGGNVVAYKINEANGRLEMVNFHQFTQFSKVNPSRQDRPHTHETILDSQTKFVYVADLGNDCIYRMNFSNTLGFDAGTLKKYSTPPGSGPRHMIVHSNAKYFYVACELSNQVLVYEMDTNGDLKLVQNSPASSKPSDPGVAEIQISEDGRFLYVSTRVLDIITVFRIGQDGRLTNVQEVKSGGKVPRMFILYSSSPNGNNQSHYALVGNQESNEITIFDRDVQSGKLTEGNHWSVNTPVCLQLVSLSGDKSAGNAISTAWLLMAAMTLSIYISVM